MAEKRDLAGRLSGVHWVVLLFAVSLVTVGIVTIGSATAELSVDFVPRQALWLVVGILACAFAIGVDHRFLARFAWPLYLLSQALLLLVLVAGQEAGGARSWIGVGSFGGQPSELAKIAAAVMLARRLAQSEESRLTWRDLGAATLIVGVPVILIILQRDLGSAAMFFPMLGAVVVVAGLRRRSVVTLIVLFAISVPLMWNYGLRDYQRQRVLSFMSQSEDPLGAGYQLQQSRIAVGSGQITGRGYMQGTQSQLRFLPARHTDFILAVLAEEWGFLGVGAVMVLYGLLFSALLTVAQRAADRTGMLLVVGLIGVLASHVVYNTAMVIGWLPITGIPLPFLSYGGSFLLANLVSLGIILGIDFRRYANL